MFLPKFEMIKNLQLTFILVLLFLLYSNVKADKNDSLFLSDLNKANKILWLSETSAISSVLILCGAGISLYESYGSNSDVILLSKDRRIAWSLFTFGVLSEGLSIFGITLGIKRIKKIKEDIEIDLSPNELSLQYKIYF